MDSNGKKLESEKVESLNDQKNLSKNEPEVK